MKLFKNKSADNLEKKLLRNIDDYYDKINLRQTVATSNEKIDNHINFGLAAGVGIGALALIGSAAMIPLAPAIAATALIGSVTVASTSILTGMAFAAGGVAYAGIGTLFKKFQESKLGSSYSRASESHRMKMVESEVNLKMNSTMYKASKGMVEPNDFEVFNIKMALQENNVDAAKQIVKDMVNRVFPNAKITNEKEETIQNNTKQSVQKQLKI